MKKREHINVNYTNVLNITAMMSYRCACETGGFHDDEYSSHWFSPWRRRQI